MFTDSHCHLNLLDLSAYDGDIDQAIQSAYDAGVTKLMTISVALSDHQIFSPIAARHQHLGYTVGVHPCQSGQELAAVSVDQLVALGQAEKVWALGETGLDYYHSCEWVDQQKQSLIAHIQAGKQLKKPIVVHTRSAKEDTVNLLRQQQVDHGILHCFTEDWDTAKAILDLGMYISLSGIVSFKNAKSLHEVAKKMPLDRLLIETDSPYLAPVPFRGKQNEPKYVPYVAEAIATLVNKPVAEIAQITQQNFEQLLNQKGI